MLFFYLGNKDKDPSTEEKIPKKQPDQTEESIGIEEEDKVEREEEEKVTKEDKDKVPLIRRERRSRKEQRVCTEHSYGTKRDSSPEVDQVSVLFVQYISL